MEESDVISELEGLNLPLYWQPGEMVHSGPASRTLAFVGDVEEQMCSAFIAQMTELIRESAEPIVIHINTSGGSAVDAFAVYDWIRACPAPVLGIVAGSCMSAGLIILSACDYRLSTPSSMFFYHQCMTGYEVRSGEESESRHALYQHLQQQYDEVIRTRAKISKAKWKKYFEGSTSKYLTATEALNHNLVDGLIGYETRKVGLKEFIAELTGGE